jgi:hypothetical protein
MVAPSDATTPDQECAQRPADQTHRCEINTNVETEYPSIPGASANSWKQSFAGTIGHHWIFKGHLALISAGLSKGFVSVAAAGFFLRLSAKVRMSGDLSSADVWPRFCLCGDAPPRSDLRSPWANHKKVLTNRPTGIGADCLLAELQISRTTAAQPFGTYVLRQRARRCCRAESAGRSHEEEHLAGKPHRTTKT